jgi:2,4-dienoyl-CoA reductase-like NADH-dependent reductase (Old Yellow Enzyme family)
MRDASPSRYPHLFAPLAIGPVTLAHRAIMSAHGMGLGESATGVSDRYRAYLLERARGGAALVGIESAPVHPSTFSRGLVIRLDRDDTVASLARLAEQVHAAGSKLAITLWHGGHKDSPLRGPYTVAPSAVPNMAGEVPKVLTRAEIADIVRGYGAAARRCVDAGVDVLEVQTATDYLLGSFLSPALNHRTDEYGDSRENRARIVCEILEVVREAARGRAAVGVRCSAEHGIPGAPVDYTLQESIATMQHLESRGLVDYVSVMAGSAWTEGASIPALHHPRVPLRETGRRFHEALAVPVFLTGRIRTAEEAESLHADGAADVLAMARTWIAEPQWIAKIAENRESEIRPCMSCNQGCVGFVFRGLPGTCVVNPRAGRELEWQSDHELGTASGELRAKAPRHQAPMLAVIGGGPAGLETARLGALAGFRVTLHEAEGTIGGAWRLAAQAPRRTELALPLKWWQGELERLGVEIRLESRVSAERPPEARHVVWAIGAAPGQTAVWRLRPYLTAGIPGCGHALHGRELMARRTPLSGRVALIDEEGGWPALSVAETLLALPAVTHLDVFTAFPAFVEAELAVTFEAGSRRAALGGALDSGRVTLHARTLVQAIREDGSLELPAGRTGRFDRVILATGTDARPYPESGLAVGDCVAPRGLWSATSDARRLIEALRTER